MFHANKPNLSWCTQKTNSIHKINLATNISKVWEGSKAGPDKVKKDSRVKSVLCNREGCCIGASKETRTTATPLRCWTHLGETEGAITTIPWPACLHLNKSFCFSSPQTVRPPWFVMCLSQSSGRFPRDGLRGSRTETSTVTGTGQTHSNPFLWQGAETTHHSHYALYKFQYCLGSNFTHTEALGRLYCSLCMASDTIARHTVQPELRENKSTIMRRFVWSSPILIYSLFVSVSL